MITFSLLKRESNQREKSGLPDGEFRRQPRTILYYRFPTSRHAHQTAAAATVIGSFSTQVLFTTIYPSLHQTPAQGLFFYLGFAGIFYCENGVYFFILYVNIPRKQKIVLEILLKMWYYNKVLSEKEVFF